MHAERALGGEHERADIERGLRFGGHPVLVHLDDRLDRLHKHLLREFRHAQPAVGIDHAPGVHLRPEELHLAVRTAIRLEPFEGLLRVVQRDAGRLQRDRTIRNDAGVVPALSGVIVHDKHMIGIVLAKPQILFIRLLLGNCDSFHTNFHVLSPPCVFAWPCPKARICRRKMIFSYYILALFQIQ